MQDSGSSHHKPRIISGMVLLSFFLTSFSFSADLNPALMKLQYAEQSQVKGESTVDYYSELLEETPELIPVFGKGDADEVESLGGDVQTDVGDYFTAFIPVSKIADFADSEAIEFIALGAEVTPALDVAGDYVNIDQSYYKGLTGSDVIVGIVDTGIDVYHEDFMSDNGLSRILYLWDQSDDSGNPPSSFSYGREWDKDDIDRGLCTIELDSIHGTHVAGIAAGNGDASSGQYRGMAPDANIVAVKVDGTINNILDAVNYVFYQAQRLDMPCVINLSLGYQAGNHRESDPFNEIMDYLVEYYGEEGRIVIWACGNEGNDPIHTTAVINPAIHTSVDIDYHDYPLELYFFYTNSSTIPVALIDPDDNTNINFTTSMYNVNNEASIIISDYAGETLVDVTIYSTSKLGRWKLIFDQSSSGIVTAHGYIVDSETGANEFHHPVYSGTITTSAAQSKSIAVGAIVTRITYTNWKGGIETDFDQNLDDIATFSGKGPTRDGGNKPDIVAPGAYIIAPMASADDPYTTSDYRVNDDYIALQGTSMAAPVVTGIVALMLEKEPDLTVDEVRDMLIQNAQGNSFKTSYGTGNWDMEFGYGIVNTEFLLTAEPATPMYSTTVVNNIVNFDSETDNTFIVKCKSNSATVNQQFQVTIYDRYGNTIIESDDYAVDEIESVQFEWDGTDRFGRKVQGGIYFALVQTGSTIERITVLVVD